MKSFNVIWWDFNDAEPESYDVIPYLVKCYNKSDHKPTTFEGFRDFVKHESQYMWWARCQYEILISDWPNKRHTVKWDIHKQVMMNIEIITNILMEEVTNGTTSEEINN